MGRPIFQIPEGAPSLSAAMFSMDPQDGQDKICIHRLRGLAQITFYAKGVLNLKMQALKYL